MLLLGATPLHRTAIWAGFRLAYGRTALGRRLRELEDSQWWSPERARDFQWARVRRLVEHAYRNVPYYRREMGSLGMEPGDVRGPEDFRRLPVLTKQLINEHREELVAETADRGQMIKTASGGSTGAPVALYHDPRMVAGYRAAKLRNFAWAGWRPGDAWARLWGSQFDVAAHKQMRQRLFDKATRVLVLPCWDLSESTMHRYAQDLQRFRPDVIEAYVTPMVHFARFVQAESYGGIRPKGIICSAELLFPHQRALIEEVFGCKVFNRYGGREMGDVAHECPAGTMHLNMEIIYTEFEGPNGACRVGETGDILLTALDSYSMPLLRYRVEDAGSPSDAVCSCGRGLGAMAVVEGRVQDLISLSGGGFLPGEFFPHLFKDFDIRQFQVEQERLEHITVRLVRGPELSDGQIEYLLGKIREYTSGKLVVDLEFCEAIPASPSGKFRYTISRVTPRLRGAALEHAGVAAAPPDSSTALGMTEGGGMTGAE